MSTRISISDNFTFGKLLRFAFPSMIMVVFTSLYGIVDGLFVANFGGENAFTAINLFLPVFYLLGAVGFLLGSGGCALIAKLLGEGNSDGARRQFGGITVIAAVTAAIFTAVFIPIMPNIAAALGASGNVHPICVEYGIIMLGGLLPFMLQNYFQYFFAVADRPKLGLAITVAAGLTNMIGDFLLVYVAKMGVRGAAIATIVGECVGGIIPLVYFFVKKGKTLYFGKPSFRIKDIVKVCTNGSSELLTSVSTSIVSILYNFQLLKYIGNAGVDAFGVLMYVSFIFIGCYLGFSVGTAPIIGYNYGAKNNAQLKNVFKKSLIFFGGTALLLTALAEALAQPLAMIFVSGNAETLALTVIAIRLFSLSFLLSGFNIYASAFFTALNNGLVSAVISISRTLVFQVCAVYIMPLIFGINGIWSATFVAEALSLAISFTMLTVYRKKYGYV